MTAGKSIVYLLVVVLLIVAFLVIVGVIFPKSAVAPAEQSDFVGPPAGEFSGFKGPTSPPPSGN